MVGSSVKALVGVLAAGSTAATAALWNEREKMANDWPAVSPTRVVEQVPWDIHDYRSPDHIRMNDERPLPGLAVLHGGNALKGGSGGGEPTYVGTTVGIGGRRDADVETRSDGAVVMGSLDKELIRQVIHRNRQQILYCYEMQLIRFPKLAGKISIQFVIGPEGTVQLAKVASSNMHNPELEQCIAARFKGWLFPKPKGGGIVQVTYPLILNNTAK